MHGTVIDFSAAGLRLDVCRSPFAVWAQSPAVDVLVRAGGEGCGRTAKHPRLEPIRRSEVGRLEIVKITPKKLAKIDRFLACAAYNTHIQFQVVPFYKEQQKASNCFFTRF